MIKIKKREKIALLFIAGTLLSTGFPALNSKKETRIESFEFPSIWMDQRDAVVALIPSRNLQKDADAQIWRTHGVAIKSSQSKTFSGQLSIAGCTGFLIAQDILLTASRCLSEGNRGAIKVVRTFQYFSKTEAESARFRPSVLDSEVTDLKEILHTDPSGFSVIKLSKKFEFARPISLKRDFPFGFGTRVATISHPMGLAKKGDFEVILSQEPDPKARLFPINAARGTSLGEPIFDPTSHAAIGLLISDSMAIQSDAIAEKLQELSIPFESL